MRKTFFIALILITASLTSNAQEKQGNSKVNHLTYMEFIDKIWDFEQDASTFNYKGKNAAIIDFYADWCGPCRRVAPIMEKLANEFDGRLDVYKINVDQEKELASVFQVRNIPTVLFIPAPVQAKTRGTSATQPKPMLQVGAMSEADYRKVIEEQLLK